MPDAATEPTVALENVGMESVGLPAAALESAIIGGLAGIARAGAKK